MAKVCFPGMPLDCQYWIAIFKATSTATEPLSARNIFSREGGNSGSNLAANSTAGSCVNPPNMIWLILSSWVLAAALSTGWLYPWTAAHQEDIPSISSLPSARVIVTPSALDTG